MQSTRQNKISRLIQQDLADIFLRDIKQCTWQCADEAELQTLRSSLYTVTSVRITPDLSIARVHLSIMPIGQGATKERLMQLVSDNAADLRRRLGMREGKQLRIIPQLDFFLDDTLDYIDNINRLLKQ